MLAGEQTNTLLVFRCWENSTEAAFVPAAVYFPSGRTEVLLRINSDAPETLSWIVGSNNRSLFITPAQDFMRLMPDNGKLFLRAKGFQGSQSDATFNLADVSAARDRIAETCHWSTPKSAKAK